ncbi:MAG: hypothetical protein ACJ0QU_02410 [Halobacteriales archaeon]
MTADYVKVEPGESIILQTMEGILQTMEGPFEDILPNFPSKKSFIVRKT